MKNLVLIVFLLVADHTLIISQCWENFHFLTQQQVNLFPELHADCDSLGTLTISGVDINDLSPLTGIKYVRDGITIRNNPILRNLKGLDSLHTSAYTINI